MRQILRISLFLGMMSASAALGWIAQAEAQVRDITMRVRLMTGGAGSKSFIWRLRYYKDTGLCIGNVRDRDGFATFSGTFDEASGRFSLVKRYPERTSGRKDYYYQGFIRGRKTASGTAHYDSFVGRQYARWNATILWSNTRYRTATQKIALTGFLRYTKGGANKSFAWNLSFNPDSYLCTGTVRDRDGFATFSGTYDPTTRRFYLVKRFVGRKAARNVFYYKGRIVGNQFVGTAHFDSFFGPVYARWSAAKRF